MRTQVTVETSDRVRFLIGVTVTGQPIKATREQVRAYFSVLLDAEVKLLEAKAEDMVRDTVAKLKVRPITED